MKATPSNKYHVTGGIMSCGIYAIRNKTNGKCYVGSTKDFDVRQKHHFDSLLKGNHINIKLQRSYHKHGADKFEFIILEIVAEYEPSIKDLEQSWIERLNSKKNGYNIADASYGDVLTNHPDRENIIIKIGAGVTRYRASLKENDPEKYHQNFIAPHEGINNANFGKHRPTHVIQAMINGTAKFVEAHGHGPTKGNKLTTEHKEILSQYAKLRVGDKNPFYGKHHNEKTKNQISEKNKGKLPANRRKVRIETKVFDSLSDAAKQTGIKNTTILFRIRSKYWDYEYLS